MVWCHYRVLQACCDSTEGGLKTGLGLLLILGGSAGVDRSIPALISCPLKVVLLLRNVPVSLRMYSSPPPVSPLADFASLSL